MDTLRSPISKPTRRERGPASVSAPATMGVSQVKKQAAAAAAASRTPHMTAPAAPKAVGWQRNSPPLAPRKFGFPPTKKCWPPPTPAASTTKVLAPPIVSKPGPSTSASPTRRVHKKLVGKEPRPQHQKRLQERRQQLKRAVTPPASSAVTGAPMRLIDDKRVAHHRLPTPPSSSPKMNEEGTKKELKQAASSSKNKLAALPPMAPRCESGRVRKDTPPVMAGSLHSWSPRCASSGVPSIRSDSNNSRFCPPWDEIPGEFESSLEDEVLSWDCDGFSDAEVGTKTVSSAVAHRGMERHDNVRGGGVLSGLPHSATKDRAVFRGGNGDGNFAQIELLGRSIPQKRQQQQQQPKWTQPRPTSPNVVSLRPDATSLQSIMLECDDDDDFTAQVKRPRVEITTDGGSSPISNMPPEWVEAVATSLFALLSDMDVDRPHPGWGAGGFATAAARSNQGSASASWSWETPQDQNGNREDSGAVGTARPTSTTSKGLFLPPSPSPSIINAMDSHSEQHQLRMMELRQQHQRGPFSSPVSSSSSPSPSSSSSSWDTHNLADFTSLD